MRFLQTLEPQVNKAVTAELTQLSKNNLLPEKQKELEEYLLIIIDNVLTFISDI